MGLIVIVAAVLLLLFVLTFGCFAGTVLLKVPNRDKKPKLASWRKKLAFRWHNNYNRCRSFAKTKP
jgi:hypothetical protein